ncbi:unnamed protein product, partial [Rotaria magnacalcarata]
NKSYVSAADDIKAMFNRYTSFQRDTITFNPKVFNGKIEASVEFLDITELTQTIEEMNGKTDFISCGKVRLSERVQKTKTTQIRRKKMNILFNCNVFINLWINTI